MTDRRQCLIPGCRRTHKPLPRCTEWICGKHWPLVPKQFRRAYAHAKRRHKSDAVLDRIWARCRRAAIAENFMRIT